MNDFLRSAEEQLKLNKDKSSVMAELEDHVETKRSFFKSIGYDENASAEKANEAMGNGEIIGQRLNQIHSRMRKASVYLIVASAIANIGLNAAILLADKGNYSIPFVAALFVLLCNLAFTYAAIKFKSLWLSAASMIFSLAAVWLSSPYLAYPLCNLIISHYSSDPIHLFNYSYVAISACVSATVFLPNGFNIHHCRQMKRLKNTKKQNRVAAALRNTCLIAGVIIFVLSFPYYAMNNSLCEEQAQIREELMDFAFETANEYNFKSKEELEKFLENSKYAFEYVPIYGYGESYERVSEHCYVYYLGNWHIEFYIDNPDIFHPYSSPQNNYSINVCNNIFNISQRYLITSPEQEEKLFETISNPRPVMYGIDESVPHSAEGMTAREIRNTISGISLTGAGIGIYDDHIAYGYSWQGLDTANRLYMNNYSFYCDGNGICTDYDLIYDYHTITASWQNK